MREACEHDAQRYNELAARFWPKGWWSLAVPETTPGPDGVALVRRRLIFSVNRARAVLRRKERSLMALVGQPQSQRTAMFRDKSAPPRREQHDRLLNKVCASLNGMVYRAAGRYGK